MISDQWYKLMIFNCILDRVSDESYSIHNVLSAIGYPFKMVNKVSRIVNIVNVLKNVDDLSNIYSILN